MRLWSLHPEYLDVKGLVACWREGLLARKVLLGETKGYHNHPQLIRFRNSGNMIAFIDNYLEAVANEAKLRGYHFDVSKIKPLPIPGKIPVTEGQLMYEINHLKEKLKTRDKERYIKIKNLKTIKSNPIFEIIKGEIESWESIKTSSY